MSTISGNKQASYWAGAWEEGKRRRGLEREGKV